MNKHLNFLQVMLKDKWTKQTTNTLPSQALHAKDRKCSTVLISNVYI